MTEGRLIRVTGWYVDLHEHRALLLSGEIAPGCPHADGLAVWRFLAPSRLGVPEPVSVLVAA